MAYTLSSIHVLVVVFLPPKRLLFEVVSVLNLYSVFTVDNINILFFAFNTISSFALISLLSSIKSFAESNIVSFPFPITPDTVFVLFTISQYLYTCTCSYFLGSGFSSSSSLLNHFLFGLTSLISVYVSVTPLLLSIRVIVLSSIFPFVLFNSVPPAPPIFPAIFSISLPSKYTIPFPSIFPIFLIFSVDPLTILLSFNIFPFSDVTLVISVPEIIAPIFVTPPFPSTDTFWPSILAILSPILAFTAFPVNFIYVIPCPAFPIWEVFIKSFAFIIVSVFPAIIDGFSSFICLLSTRTPSSLLYAPLKYFSVPFTIFPFLTSI